MEVGTGWYPMVPLGLWFLGAERIFTFDLNRHLSPRVTSRALKWMAGNQEELIDVWDGLVPADRIREKVALVERMKNRPLDLLEQAGIRYLAPADASLSGLDDNSVDIHFSLYTFEHIPQEDLRAILREGARVLRPGGVAIHRVDPKDHFSGTDPSITKINFLGFTESKWRKHFGHRLSYQNRLHDPEFRALFEESGLRLLEREYKTDERSLAALKAGFSLAPPFDKQDREELCRYALDYVATPRLSHEA
jgi:SAM-dependent methyltransferase